MSKKFQLIFAFMLGALTSGVFAVPLDVIYRDFPVDAPGFEEFMACDADGNNNSTPVRFEGRTYNTENKGTELRYGNCTGNNPAERGYKNGPDALSCNNNQWEWDNPIRVTLGMVGKNLHYDTDNCKEEDIQEDTDQPNNPRDFIKYRYCARPTAGNDNCSSKSNPGNKIEQWFGNGSQVKEVRDYIELDWRNSDNAYVIEYNYNKTNDWNKDGSDNGFFPLDKYDDDKSGKTWGRQSINEWCGYDNGGSGFNKDRNDICKEWDRSGGPKDRDAGRKTAQSRGILKKLHNYGFSAAGSGAFKYSESGKDIFEFIGDDDMWIFIDGELVADLGGVHLAAPAKIDIQEYGKRKGWQNNTMHAVNFFYMDRNTDGSNFKLKLALNELSPSRFGAPRILKAKTTQNPDGSSQTKIYVSNKLDEESIKQFIGEKDKFPVVIKKVGSNNLYGFQIESIKDLGSEGSEGYAYIITGNVCKSKTECGGKFIISSGDSLSFNVLFDDLRESGYTPFDGLALPDNNWYIKTSSNKTPATKVSWAINTTSMPPIVFEPDVTDKNPKKPDFNVDNWFTGDPNKNDGGGKFSTGSSSLANEKFGNTNGTFPSINQIWDNNQGKLVDLPNGKGNTTVHGFGTKGTPIPLNRTGELILTAYPNAGTDVHTVNGNISYAEWDTSSTYQKLFGLPPKPKNDNLFGIADPTVQQPNGGYMFVKNGFKGESSVGGIQVAPTRCIADGDELVGGNAPRINCLNFSVPAKQPFQLAVIVYDQLGNFVTQYRETVNEKDFRSVVQGPTFIERKPSEGSSGYVNPSDKCRYPTGPEDFGKKDIITTNGLVKVNVNIYPFSKDGRRFGNGVYILKVDRVDLPYEGCMNSAGNSLYIKEDFVRYHSDTKFGWMRSTN